MQQRHILLSEVEGKPAICFDTGLEPRSFARTKMSQSLIEKGYIVNPDGSYEAWMSSGVCEFNNHMRVWGKPIPGERFDFILNKIDNSENQQAALKAVACWIKAKMFLGDIYTTFNPAATFISPDGKVFFAPPNLSNRCLHVEGMEYDYYNCPDLMGMDAAAFCAAAMLYKIFTKSFPYANKLSLYQDMREGVFLPPHLASPDLNKDLCTLIQAAFFLPVEKKKSSQNLNKSALDILSEMLSLISSTPLFESLSNEEKQKKETEKKYFLLKQNIYIKTKRFTARNKYPLMGAALGLFFVLFVIFSTRDGMRRRPTTEGMLSDSVVYTYYNSFSSLDHIFMESCTQGSDPIIKGDISVAVNFFALYKSRQSYENTRTMPFVTARAWIESGKELPAPDVFGVTDLTLEYIAGSEESDMIIYRASYLLWAPNEHARERIDTVTLQRDRKKHWRITEILRTER